MATKFRYLNSIIQIKFNCIGYTIQSISWAWWRLVRRTEFRKQSTLLIGVRFAFPRVPRWAFLDSPCLVRGGRFALMFACRELSSAAFCVCGHIMIVVPCLRLRLPQALRLTLCAFIFVVMWFTKSYLIGCYVQWLWFVISHFLEALPLTKQWLYSRYAGFVTRCEVLQRSCTRIRQLLW